MIPAVATPHRGDGRGAPRARARGHRGRRRTGLGGGPHRRLPHNCALGGDLIALVREPDGTVTVVNASGPAAAASTWRRCGRPADARHRRPHRDRAGARRGLGTAARAVRAPVLGRGAARGRGARARRGRRDRAARRGDRRDARRAPGPRDAGGVRARRDAVDRGRPAAAAGARRHVVIGDGVQEPQRLARLQVLGRRAPDLQVQTSWRPPRWRARFGARSGLLGISEPVDVASRAAGR